jgi:hypothetical protein
MQIFLYFVQLGLLPSPLRALAALECKSAILPICASFAPRSSARPFGRFTVALSRTPHLEKFSSAPRENKE